MSASQPDMAAQAAIRQSMDDSTAGTRNSSANLPSAQDSANESRMASENLGEGNDGLAKKMNPGISLPMGETSIDILGSSEGIQLITSGQGAFNSNIFDVTRNTGLNRDPIDLQPVSIGIEQISSPLRGDIARPGSKSQGGGGQSQ